MRKPFREAELFDMMHKHLGVRFIYEGTEAAGSVPVSDNAALTDLPADLLEQLRQALKELDVDAVEAAIQQIRSHDAILANKLAQMSYRYEYDRMRELFAGNEAALN